MRCGQALLLCVLFLACTTPLELGERRYREGDRLGALEVWRSIPPESPHHAAAQQRTDAAVEEFQQLVLRYKKRARYYEAKGRLAESVLNYRLALELRPDDDETFDHVQALSRSLAKRKRSAFSAFHTAFKNGELAEARSQLARLRRADPFDPKLESEERQLEEALRREIERRLARGRRGYSSGNHAGAASAFEDVLALDPGNETAQGYLSYIATIRKQEWSPDRRGPLAGLARAPRPFEPPEVNATDAEIRAEGAHQNALAAERRAEPYSAIEHELAALRANPRHAGALAHLARLRHRLAPEVERLIAAGRHHFGEEELEAALDQWRRALLIDPENEDASKYIIRAEHMLENLEQLRSQPAARKRRR